MASGFGYFERGDGPLVSVLFPTRGRANLLNGALDSLFTLASCPADIEVLLKVDDDDVPTIRFAEKVAANLPVTAHVSPRGGGYADNHLWLDDLSRKARGDWLMVFNDDARMLTPGWDNVLEAQSICTSGDDLCIFMTQIITRPGSSEIFFLRKTVHTVLGHFSPTPHADTWFYSVLALLGRAFFLPVRVEHFNDAMGDGTATDRRRVSEATVPALVSNLMVRRKLQDVNKLLRYIEEKERDRDQEGPRPASP